MIGGSLQLQCCCPVGPFPSICDPPTTGSYVRLTQRTGIATSGAFESVSVGACNLPTPPSCTVSVPSVSPSIGSCSSSYSFSGTEPFGERSGNYSWTTSHDNPTNIVVDVYWTFSNNISLFSRRWIDPTGYLTELPTSLQQRVDYYESAVAQTKGNQSGPCGTGCWTISVDPSCGTWNAKAQFTNWPFHPPGPGPQMWTIRRQGASTASRWDVVGGVFRLKNSSNVVLWTLTLSGLTLEQARNQIDTQIVAPVTCLWVSVTPPVSPTTEALPATYIEDQTFVGPGSNIATAGALSPSPMYLWVLPAGQTRLYNEPASGTCVDVGSGWTSAVGGGTFYNSFNVNAGFTDGVDCGYAEYSNFCGGIATVSLAGFYNPLNPSLYPPGSGCSGLLSTSSFDLGPTCGWDNVVNYPSSWPCSGSITAQCPPPPEDVSCVDDPNAPLNNCIPTMGTVPWSGVPTSFKPMPLGQNAFECSGPVDSFVLGPNSGSSPFQFCCPEGTLDSWCVGSAAAIQTKIYWFAEIRRMA